jgi:hypothetical protein
MSYGLLDLIGLNPRFRSLDAQCGKRLVIRETKRNDLPQAESGIQRLAGKTKVPKVLLLHDDAILQLGCKLSDKRGQYQDANGNTYKQEGSETVLLIKHVND